MKVKKLKEILENIPDDYEIFVRNSHNICGNISELAQVEKSKYGSFGQLFDCIILNSENCSVRGKDLVDENYNFIEYRETSGIREE